MSARKKIKKIISERIENHPLTLPAGLSIPTRPKLRATKKWHITHVEANKKALSFYCCQVLRKKNRERIDTRLAPVRLVIVCASEVDKQKFSRRDRICIPPGAVIKL